MTQNLGSDFEALVSQIQGTKCAAVTGGGAAGSVIGLHFGRRIPRLRTVANTQLPEWLRTHQGEYQFLVECAWRMAFDTDILAASGQRGELDALTRSAIGQLEGKEVVSVCVTRPAYDLRLMFNGSYTLEIFCDENAYDPDGVNYRFFCGDAIFVVGPRSTLSLGHRLGGD